MEEPKEVRDRRLKENELRPPVDMRSIESQIISIQNYLNRVAKKVDKA